MKKIKETAGFLCDLAAFGLIQNNPQIALVIIILLAIMAGATFRWFEDRRRNARLGRPGSIRCA